jgi:hypothetical protein
MAHVEEEIERYLSQLNDNDTVENEQQEMIRMSDELKSRITYLQARLEQLQSQKKLLEKLERDTLAPADLNAKVMKSKDGFLPAYNVQSMVDNDTHFILSCEATDYPTDFHSLEENATTLKEQLSIVPQTYLADGGYANEEQIRALEQQGITCIVPFPKEPERKKMERAHGIAFSYDENSDCFTCSQGKKLLLIKKSKMYNHYYKRYQCKNYGDCAVKQYCTQSKTGRTMYKRVDAEWIEAYKEKLKTTTFKQQLKARKCTVEHPF